MDYSHEYSDDSRIRTRHLCPLVDYLSKVADLAAALPLDYP